MAARSWLCALCALPLIFAGCAPQSGAHLAQTPVTSATSATAVTHTATSATAVTHTATSAPSAGSARGEPTASHSEPAPATGTDTERPALAYAFKKVHDGPVSSFALATPPKLGILVGADAFVYSGREWTTLPPIPGAEHAHFNLFFGRDYEPRLMGTVERAGDAPRYFYKRFKAKRWQDEPSELGPFANGTAPLYGVLGLDDPEVVCRPGAQCLIKRISGWSRVPAHPSAVRVMLAGGTAWALYPGHVERLERSGFASFGPARAWGDPSSVWVDASGAPWVVDRAERTVFRLENGAWLRLAPPLGEPRALWGHANDDVWLVGGDGAAHFDGKTWQRVRDVSGPLDVIAEVGRELWMAGVAGVFQGVRR